MPPAKRTLLAQATAAKSVRGRLSSAVDQTCDVKSYISTLEHNPEPEEPPAKNSLLSHETVAIFDLAIDRLPTGINCAFITGRLVGGQELYVGSFTVI